MPGLQALDAVRTARSRCGHTASYYYFGKDPTFALRHRGAVRPQLSACRTHGWSTRRRRGAAERVLRQSYNIFGLLAGNTGGQMGGWFRKEIKTVDDLKGLKMRIGGFAGKVMQKLGVVPQQIAGGDIYPALEKGTIDAAPNGSARTTTRSSASTRSRQFYYYPGWWEGGADAAWPTSTGQVERACRKPTSRSWSGRATRRTPGHDRQVRCAQSGGAPPACSRRRQAPRLLAGRHGRLLQGGQGAVRRNLGEQPDFKKMLRLR